MDEKDIILTIKSLNGISISNLARVYDINRMTMSRMVAVLEAKKKIKIKIIGMQKVLYG